MRTGYLFFLIVTAAAGLGGIGCCRVDKVQPYTGPTLPMRDVVSRVNSNNELIPTLWTNIDFGGSVMDKGRRWTIPSGSGVLLFRRPGDLFIRGSTVFGPVFEVGSNAETYWLKLVPQINTAWHGLYRNLGKPCVEPLPIRPDLLVEVLGVGTFNTNFLEQPVPVMRVEHDRRAYVFTWNVRLADRWAVQKEVWYDIESFNPTKVVLFDANGRTVLRADLEGALQLEASELPADKRPFVAKTYTIEFMDSQTRLELKLFEPKLKKGRLPNNGSFRMPGDDQWGVEKVINVDANCTD